MKRYLMTILAVVLTTFAVKAMPYEMAREEALYLTDKMAYELNLNERQYEYAYEINLDYLMSLDRAEDAYGMYLTFRNNDLRHILYDWQWSLFATVDYFFRPVSWRYGRWYYPVYGYYSRNYYYYSRPAVYHNYRGGHGHSYYDRGFYVDRRPRWDGGLRGADRTFSGRGHVGQGYRIEQTTGRPGNMNYGRPGNVTQGRPGNVEQNRPGNVTQGRPGNVNGGMSGNRPNMGTFRGNTGGNAGGNRVGGTMNSTPRGGGSMGSTPRGNAGGMSAGRGHR